MKKQKKKTFKFPSIYRIIPDVFLFLFLAIIVATVYMGLIVYKNLSLQENFLQQKEKIVSQILYWQDVVAKHGDYRDAYFTLALLEYQLGEKQKTRYYLEKALTIDPNFEQGRQLEQLLLSNK